MQVVDDRLKAGGQRAAPLPVHHLPRREVDRNVSPWSASADYPAQADEDIAKLMDQLALLG
jgi:hypothetical protein